MNELLDPSLWLSFWVYIVAGAVIVYAAARVLSALVTFGFTGVWRW